MALKTTPFYSCHREAGARLIDFSGWSLPLEYKGILKETKHVRTACGLFDASHMGELRIKGKGAHDFLQYLTSNDLALTRPGQLQYNLFINPQGGIIDDCMIYNLGEDLLCVVNAANTEKVYNWLRENKKDRAVEIIDQSRATALLSLQGPKSLLLAEDLFGGKISFPYMHFVEKTIAAKKILLSRSGYTGEDGFELYLSSGDAQLFWDKIVSKGKACGLSLCGLGARDILRIEAGYPLYGHEIDDTRDPLEASLHWAVRLNKDFMGKDEIVKRKEGGIKKKRVGFILEERAFAREGYPLYSEEKLIGEVSSGTYSPNLDKFIGMAYLESNFAGNGTPVKISVRGKLYQARVAPLPFVEIKTKRKRVNIGG